jgi:DNA-binding response OmpR family regulator
MNRPHAHRLVDTFRRSVRGLLGARSRKPEPTDEPIVADPPAARVLVVESGPAARDALASELSRRGFDVVTAARPDEAVARMSDDVDGFDLLVAGPAAARSDCDLLVRTVRRGGEADLAVVIVTAGAEPGPELERAGADAVLDGSLGAELIARASEAVLSRKRQRRRAS